MMDSDIKLACPGCYREIHVNKDEMMLDDFIKCTYCPTTIYNIDDYGEEFERTLDKIGKFLEGFSSLGVR